MTVSAYRLACMFLNVLTVIAHWQEVFDAFGDMRNERKWNLDVQLMEDHRRPGPLWHELSAEGSRANR